MKTQNKQNKRQKNNSETQNRTEQLSENGTANTLETQSQKNPHSEFRTPNSEAATLAAGGEDQGEVVSSLTPNSALPTPNSIKPYVNFAERDFNRKLSVEQVLEKLRRWMPKQYELAEVVGKWIWITFPESPAERVRAD